MKLFETKSFRSNWGTLNQKPVARSQSLYKVKNGLTMIKICKETIAYTFQNFEPQFVIQNEFLQTISISYESFIKF